MDRTSDLGIDKPPERPKRRNKSVRNYENVNIQAQVQKAPVPQVPRITALPWDSDDDPICSASESLEDEIFKELERASFDEDKLNEAIKNFDKILNDYKEEEERQINASATAAAAPPQPVLELKKAPAPLRTKASVVTAPIAARRSSVCQKDIQVKPTSVDSAQSVLKGKSKIPLSRQVLTKSKTCSIIESKCILKKSLSHDGDLSYCVKMQRQSTNDLSTSKPMGTSKVARKPIADATSVKQIKELQTCKKALRPLTSLSIPVNKPGHVKTIDSSLMMRSVDKSIAQRKNVVVAKKDPLKRAKSDYDITLGGRVLAGSRIPVKLIMPLESPGQSINHVKLSLVRTPSSGIDSIDGDFVKPPALIQYAKVVSASNPKMESCKVIPAVPFSGAPKDQPTPVPVKDATKCSATKVCKLLQKVMSEQDYQSDNSDDSGHISNEHDESASSNADAQSPFESEKLIVKVEAPPGKISGDLLKYFDSTHKEEIARIVDSKISASERSDKEVPSL